MNNLHALLDGHLTEFGIVFIQRLKDKMGNHANASSEVEFDQVWLNVGEVGAGLEQS